MKLRKIELKLEGDQYWPILPIVHVGGDATAMPIPDGALQPELEEIIRSWDKAAILKITPNDGKAMVGFWVSSGSCQYLNVPVETTNEGLFAMRLGSGPTDFFIVPQDHQTNYQLEYIETAKIDELKHKNVPLY